MGYPPQGTGVGAHHTSHEDGGSDEINITGLAGLVTTFAALTDVKVVRKTADQTVSNSIVLVNDNHLVFAVAANEIWEFILWLIATTTAVAGFRCAFTIPAAGGLYLPSSAGATYTILTPWTNDGMGIIAMADGTIVKTNAAAMAAGLSIFRGRYIGGANAGNIQFQWAQKAAEVSNTQVLTNSFLIAHKLA